MTDKLFIICLIESVKKHPCLWDSTSASYAKRDKLEKAWQQIAKECGHPVSYCRDKWKNVRTGFLRSLREYPENAGTLTTSKRKPFYLHENMRFLLPSIMRNDTSSQLSYDQLSYMKTESGDGSGCRDGDGGNRIGNENEFVKVEEGSNSDLLEEYEELDNFENFEFSQKEGYFTHFGPCRSISPRRPFGSSDATRKKYRVTCDDNGSSQYDSREELALMSFFKGIASDVLSLPVRKQRFFKRKIVELVDELHKESDDL